ncbi:MAG: hypothetical protein MO852_15895, partial [Candidatus Devosia euplotis]|nr:hypothetical protein [Candidatus Devosia euplotis]
ETDAWLDKGGLAKNLDTAAAGQKAAPITVVVRDVPFLGLDGFLAEHAPAFVREHFGAHPKKGVVVAIGDKALDVAEAAAKVASDLSSVSIHAGIDGGEDYAGLVRHLERKGPMPSPGRAGRVDLDGLKKTKVYVSGSADHGSKLLALSRRLKGGGVTHDTALFEGGDGAWADRSLDWLHFHGATLNGASHKTGLKDVSAKLEREGASSREAFDQAFDKAKARVRNKIDETLKALDSAATEVDRAKLPPPIKTALADDVKSKRKPHERRLADLDSLPSTDDPRRAAKALLELEDRLEGAGPVPVGPVVEGWSKIPAADRKRLTALIGNDEAAATALATILVAKSNWLVETEPKRKSKFIDQLESRIERGFLERADLGEFLADAIKGGDPWLDNFETKRHGPERWYGDKFVSTSYIEEHEPDGTAKVPFIPPSMQKQSADEGGFFIRLIRSKSVGKDMRAGVYLPPGYDPNSDERYPVLMLLPGKGGKVETWLDKG